MTSAGLVTTAGGPPPGEGPIPAAPRPLARPASVLGAAWRLSRNGLSAWSEQAYEEDMLVGSMLFRRSVVANCPAAVKYVLLDHADNFARDRLGRLLLKPLGQGLLTSEGAAWRRQRRIMAPAFHPRRVEGFAPVMTASAAEQLERWRRLPAGTIVNIVEQMAGLTLDIIIRTMFASDIGAEAPELRAAMTHYQVAAGRPSIPDLLGLPSWVPWRRSEAARNTTSAIDQTIRRLIAERRASGGPSDDLLGLLLAARDEETGEGMSDGQLRDELATIITAGHETTANALTWTWYLLALHPWAEQTLDAELDAVLAGRPAAHADIPRLGYTRMVIDEAMRLYPPAHTIGREAIADDEILGVPVAAGTGVFISPWLLHRHKKLWERPERFDPSRFAPDQVEQRPRYGYIPFGAGPRICIGAHFALTEAVIILATLAQHFRPRLIPGHRVEPVGLITLAPKGGLPMRLDRR